MALIWLTDMSVEEYLQLGQDDVLRPRCLSCKRTMQRWSGYQRAARQQGTDTTATQLEATPIPIRRFHCPDCNWTPGLLPSFLFSRRQDVAEEIGRALVLLAGGERITTAAQAVTRPPSTVRDWWRRLRERARKLAHGVAGLAVEIGAEIDEVHPIPLDWCLAMLAQVLKQLERRGRPATLWSCASWLSGGAWLATNTSPLPNSALIPRLLWDATANGP